MLSNYLSDASVLLAVALVFGFSLEATIRGLALLIDWLSPGDGVPTAWRVAYGVVKPFVLLIVGAGTGAVGFEFGAPVPEAFGSEVGGSILFYALAGVVAALAYEKLKALALSAIDRYRLTRDPDLDPEPPAKK